MTQTAIEVSRIEMMEALGGAFWTKLSNCAGFEARTYLALHAEGDIDVRKICDGCQANAECPVALSSGASALILDALNEPSREEEPAI